MEENMKMCPLCGKIFSNNNHTHCDECKTNLIYVPRCVKCERHVFPQDRKCSGPKCRLPRLEALGGKEVMLPGSHIQTKKSFGFIVKSWLNKKPT